MNAIDILRQAIKERTYKELTQFENEHMKSLVNATYTSCTATMEQVDTLTKCQIHQYYVGY